MGRRAGVTGARVAGERGVLVGRVAGAGAAGRRGVRAARRLGRARAGLARARASAPGAAAAARRAPAPAHRLHQVNIFMTLYLYISTAFKINHILLLFVGTLR